MLYILFGGVYQPHVDVYCGGSNVGIESFRREGSDVG